MRMLIALAILVVVALPAFAGECPLGGSCAEGSCDVDGFACQNACPLAKQANASRSLGGESATISAIVRKDLADTVAANLQRI